MFYSFYPRLVLLLLLLLLLLRSRLVAELRDLFDISWSRSLPLYLEYPLSRITLAPFDLLGLAFFGTRLAGRIGIRVLVILSTSSSILKASRHILAFPGLMRSS